MLTPPATVLALLFASGEPLTKKYLMTLLGISAAELDQTLAALDEFLRDSGLVTIETTTAIELRTAPDAAPFLKKLREGELSRDLGKASLETLAVIAYQDGATRGEIDWVRGVNSSASVRTLLLRGLIEGKEDERDKRRIRYTLTSEALAHLGLRRLADLPRKEELAATAQSLIDTETTDMGSAT